MKQVKTYTIRKVRKDIFVSQNDRSSLIENKSLNELNDYFDVNAKSIKSLISKVNSKYSKKNAFIYIQEYIELVNETTQENKENKDFIQNHFIIATIK